MQHINSQELYTNGQYRFEYVSKFMDFGAEDIEAIKAVAEQVRPLIPAVVDAVYAKLFTFDVTKKHFAAKNEGFTGEVPVSLEELTMDHPQIKFRKDFLGKYFNKVLSGPYDDRFLRYLDWVAKMHTDTPEKKSKLNVDYIHMNALLGFVESALVGGILSLNLDRKVEAKAILALNKVLWIQNDYFAKYYCNPDSIHDANISKQGGSEGSSSLARLLSPAALVPLAVGAIAGALGVFYQLRRA